MASNLSIAQVLKQLEERVAHHRERQTFHAEQEMLHRERTAHHAAGLETASTHLEAFRAASTAAGDLLERDKPAAPFPPDPESDPELDKRRSLSRMVARVVEGRAPDEAFGARSVTREILQRWGAKMRRKPDPRSVAAALRRRARSGHLHQVREGRAHHEALYRKTPPEPVPAGEPG